MAYGQTGSGKTFSIFGPPKHKRNQEGKTAPVCPLDGIIPRAAEDLFDRIRAEAGTDPYTAPYEYKVEVSLLQIYMESLGDLLAPKTGHSPPLAIREEQRSGST